MSNNAIFMRSKDVKSLGGKKAVLFNHAYNYEVSVLAKEKLYGSEANYDRIVNIREKKALQNTEAQSAVSLAVCVDKWTHIPADGYAPVFSISADRYQIWENDFPPVVGFVMRSGYKYTFMPYADAPETWRLNVA